MKRFIVLFIFTTFYSLLNADTIIVSGDVSGIWSADTVYVVGEITIPAEETLYIESGVDVIFNGHYKFIINGYLEAIGTEVDSILFTAADTLIGWHGLRFIDVPDSSHLSYCIIQYGWATGPEPDNCGGGIYCFNSSVIIKNVIIMNNLAIGNETGGGLGGGLYCDNSSINLLNVIINNNGAGSELPGGGCGGGIYFKNSSAELENVIIKENDAYTAGGIACWESSPSLENVLIKENNSIMGGGINCWFSSPSLLNVTITDNNGILTGGGIYCENNSSPNLINCILWNDSPIEICFDQYSELNSITISYSNIQGGEAGIITNNSGTVYWLEGNIDSNPLFLGNGEYPYSLLDDSPCVNAGTPDTTGLNLPEFDLAGNPRVYGGRIDMGAYENQNVVGSTEENLIPLVTKLNQNYPNPFNPETTISFSVTQTSSFVTLDIYNIKGQKVKTLVNEILPAGEHSAIWNGKDDNGNRVGSGIYFFKMKAGDFQKVRKMILIK